MRYHTNCDWLHFTIQKIELSSLNIILVIRDQSGSEIYGHTVCFHKLSDSFELMKIKGVDEL